MEFSFDLSIVAKPMFQNVSAGFPTRKDNNTVSSATFAPVCIFCVWQVKVHVSYQSGSEQTETDVLDPSNMLDLS